MWLTASSQALWDAKSGLILRRHGRAAGMVSPGSMEREVRDCPKNGVPLSSCDRIDEE